MESIHNHAITDTSKSVNDVDQNIAMGNADGVFTPADVLNVFDATFLDEEICRSLVIGKVNTSITPMCPECKERVNSVLLPSFWKFRRIRCWNCGKYFTALTGTFLSGCHFNFREIVLLAFMLALGVDDKQIAETLKISAESVRLWRHRFAAIEKSKQIESGENNGN